MFQLKSNVCKKKLDVKRVFGDFRGEVAQWGTIAGRAESRGRASSSMLATAFVEAASRRQAEPFPTGLPMPVWTDCYAISGSSLRQGVRAKERLDF